MIAAGAIQILNSMVGDGLTEKVTSEWSPERSQGEGNTAVWVESILDAVKQVEIHPGGGHVWHAQGKARRPVLDKSRGES